MSIRTQVYLGENQIEELKFLAEKSHSSVSKLIRKGVDTLLTQSRKIKSKKNQDPLFKMIGSVKGGRKDASLLDSVLYS